MTTKSLFMQYRHHSVFKRMEAAKAEGRNSIVMYRPRHPVRSNIITDGLLELMKDCSLKVSRIPSDNVQLVKYVISGFEGNQING